VLPLPLSALRSTLVLGLGAATFLATGASETARYWAATHPGRVRHSSWTFSGRGYCAHHKPAGPAGTLPCRRAIGMGSGVMPDRLLPPGPGPGAAGLLSGGISRGELPETGAAEVYAGPGERFAVRGGSLLAS
jgi:hypothetical protein